MATLTDRYVQALVKYNDSLQAQNQAKVQAEYDAWAKKNKQKSVSATVSPVTEPVDVAQAEPVEPEKVDVAKTDSSNTAPKTDGGVMLGGRLEKIFKRAGESLKNITSKTISSILQNGSSDSANSYEQNEEYRKAAQNLVGNAIPTLQTRENIQNDFEDIYNYSKSHMKGQNYSADVTMDENGNVDVGSVKQAARKKQKAQNNKTSANKDTAANDQITYPTGLQFTDDGSLDLRAMQPQINTTSGEALINAAMQSSAEKEEGKETPVKNYIPSLLDSPVARMVVEQTREINELEKKVDNLGVDTQIAYYGQKWLDPRYKMTDSDKEKYKHIVEEWEKENGEEGKKLYEWAKATGSASTPQFADYPELGLFLDINKKLDVTNATSMGFYSSLDALNAFNKAVAKSLGVSDDYLKNYEENMALDLANANEQNRNAVIAGNVTGTLGQYALVDALLGGATAGNSIYNAAKNARNITRLEGFGKGMQAAQAAKAATATFATNVGKQMIPDLLIDTLGNVRNNVENDADLNTIASDARDNILRNLALNAGIELGFGALGAIGGGISDLAKGSKYAKEAVEKAKNASDAEKIPFIDEEKLYPPKQRIEDVDYISQTVPNGSGTGGGVNNVPVSAEVVDNVAKNAENAVKPVDEVAQNVAEDARAIADDTRNIDNVAREISEDTGLRPDELTIVPETRRAVQTAEPEIPEGMKERSYARNIREGNVPTDETIQDVFTTTPRTYKPISNAQTKADVDAIMANGTDYAQRVFDGIKGSADARFAPLGHNIAQEYAKAGRYADAARVLDEVSEELTKAGQMNQAAIITMVKDDPMTALNYLERQVDKLNVEGAKKYKDKWHELSLTDDEIKAMSQIKPGDEKAIKEMWEKVGDRIAMEYPSSMMEKLLEARKVAMLLNSRTLIRNFGANVPTLGMRWLSDRFASLGEHGYRLINPNYKMTQSLTGGGRASHKLANEIYNGDYVKALREGTSGKYEIPELKNEIFKRKTMYKGTALDKLAESAGLDIEGINKKLFGRSNVHSLGETTRNLTYKLLDIGDSPFMRKNFEDRLSSYISANGIKSMADVPQEAIDIAWQEALKATYKDNSWAVKAVTGFRNAMRKIPGVGEPLAQAVIPFVQAPGNIAARMVDYSAIGGTSGAVKLISQIAKGAKNADVNMVREGIDQLSKGMTGTALVALGVALYNSGIITGSYSSDKDQRQFQKQSGYREYALHVGDKYYTYDWAQPAAENLLIGTILADAIKRSDEYDSDMLKYYGIEDSKLGRFTGAVKQGAKESINSWFNESPLQGLADLMKGDNRSYDTDIAGNIWDTAVVDFASSFIPSSFNALAKTTDNSQRQTRDYTNEYASFINAQKAKIPGLSDDLPAKYDTWGREMTYGDTKADAFFNRFINPGDTGVDKHDPLDEEINRLFNETQDAKVFPQVAPTSANGEKLTAEEYSQYQQNMGQRSHEMVEDLMKSDLYEKMTDEQKADMLAKLYNGSKALTENELYDKDYSDKVAKLYKEGGMDKVISYYSAQNALEQNGLGTGSDKVNAYVEGAKDPWKAAKDLSKATDMMKSTGLLDKDAKQPTADLMDKYEELGYKGLKDYGNAVKEARKAGVMGENSTTMPESVQEFYDNYGVDGVKDYASAMDTLRKNGLLKEDSKSLPKEVREIYAQSGMKGVNDYVTIETNQKGASYSGYQKIQGQIPYLTATEYNNIYNQFSVPTESGNYNATFSKDAELIPYLTSRTWSNDNELNIYAHALAPSVEGTWHIKNNQLYYNKPSVEKWNG